MHGELFSKFRWAIAWVIVGDVVYDWAVPIADSAILPALPRDVKLKFCANGVRIFVFLSRYAIVVRSLYLWRDNPGLLVSAGLGTSGPTIRRIVWRTNKMLERPTLSDDAIRRALLANYGIFVTQIDFLPIGYDSTASVFRVAADDGMDYFLKTLTVPVVPATLSIPSFLGRNGVE